MTQTEATKEYLTLAAKFLGAESADNLHPELVMWLIRLSAGIHKAYAGVPYRTEAELRSTQVIGLACMTWQELNPDKPASSF